MILVAMPAYNEAKYIGGVISEVKKYTKEIIVVDDGSEDRTARIAKAFGALVIKHGRNMGYGATIQDILVEARKRAFSALVIMDADTQHYPSDIPKLVSPIHGGYDLVIGKRDRKDISLFRNLGGIILSIFTRILSGKNIEDSQCGFRAYSMKAVAAIMPKEKGMAISSEIISEATKHHLKIIEVPISIRYTGDSSTMNPIAQGFYTLYKVLVMILRRRLLA